MVKILERILKRKDKGQAATSEAQRDDGHCGSHKGADKKQAAGKHGSGCC